MYCYDILFALYCFACPFLPFLLPKIVLKCNIITKFIYNKRSKRSKLVPNVLKKFL